MAAKPCSEAGSPGRSHRISRLAPRERLNEVIRPGPDWNADVQLRNITHCNVFCRALCLGTGGRSFTTTLLAHRQEPSSVRCQCVTWDTPFEAAVCGQKQANSLRVSCVQGFRSFRAGSRRSTVTLPFVFHWTLGIVIDVRLLFVAKEGSFFAKATL